MSLRWRWSVVVVLAAIVLGGFVPQALLSRPFLPVGATAMAAQSAPSAPSGCTGVICNKSSPGTPTPTLTIAALAAVGGMVVGVVGGRLSRRIRSLVRALPRGTTPFLFRPPQFS
jgi:ABC-type Fe3+ transport system permease subunit